MERHFKAMKDGAIVCNTGHYDCEINLSQLAELSGSMKEIRTNTDRHIIENGKRIYVLAKGRLVNLAAAEGHPSEVMDMSFANQYLSLVRMNREGAGLKPAVYEIPEEQDQEIAELKLATQDISIDALSEEQVNYATDYSAGT